MWAARFYGPALVWAVRAAEILMRDFVLAPHFMQEGHSWTRSLRMGSKILGSNEWNRAFAKAEEWWGPFDEPLTTDDSNAWQVWVSRVVKLRGDIIHGRPVTDATHEESLRVLGFVERMLTWYPQRFLVSPRHPMSQEFLAALEAARREMGNEPNSHPTAAEGS